ncbi:MAG TPA: DinB family protein [Chitinophagales bacterium]|nr:DinB family protein [Chitinophagales bacterium]
MKRSELTSLPEYFDRYINQCDDVELIAAIDTSIDELVQAPVEKWKALGDKVYAPGKWTIKDTLQHLIDTERIFCYRALAFARGEKQTLPGFDEEIYASNAGGNNRPLEKLIAELILSHHSVKALFESFTDEMLNSVGKGFKGEYSVSSIGFILPGHQRWHLKILKEKYYPLI